MFSQMGDIANLVTDILLGNWNEAFLSVDLATDFYSSCAQRLNNISSCLWQVFELKTQTWNSFWYQL